MGDTIELSNYLNNTPERGDDDSYLLKPINIDDLHWDDFQNELSVSDRSIRLFKRKLTCIKPKSRRHQIFCYSEVLKYDAILQPRSIKMSLSFLFNVPRHNIASMIHSYKCYMENCDSISNKGHPLTLSSEQMNTLITTISEKEKQYQPMSQSEIVNFVYTKFDKHVSKRWVKRLVEQINSLSFVDAEPLGDLRSSVTKKQVINYFSILKNEIQGVHPDLVYIVDEIGFISKINGKKKKVIIFSHEGQKKDRHVYFNPPEDETTNFTLIAAVTLSGDRVKPMPC